MRRGRIFIYLALIIIIVVAGGWFYLTKVKKPVTKPGTQATQNSNLVQVVSAAQNIAPGTIITQAMLSTYPLPEQNLSEAFFRDPAEVVNMYATRTIPQGSAITKGDVSSIPGNVNLPGSSWSTYIPQGLTAISIPITRLSASSYGIRDGDYINVIVSMLLIDIDPATQSALPNKVGSVKIDNGAITVSPTDLNQGNFVLDDVANALGYTYPSENQRPRLVTQMIMQNIQVLHVGSFPLPGQANSDILNSTFSVQTPTPQPSGQAQTTSSIEKPDLITLMVNPQDAVTLTYLIYSGAEINLTLRNPNDQSTAAQPDAAMLEYLLTQYNIPIPSKLPYSLDPRLDVLKQPSLPNDVVVTP
jgi:Flp pilus assembly protein CpaB